MIMWNSPIYLIIIDDSGVVKNSLINPKIIKRYFFIKLQKKTTVGFEFCSFNTKINNKIIRDKFGILGIRIYRSIISSFYKSSFLWNLVYSIHDKNSF